MSKVLVTGGAGFIGSHLVDLLIDNGHDVVVIDNLSSGKKENLNPRSKFYQTDVLNDLSEIFEMERFEFVFHEAAQMNVRRSIENPMFDSRVNIEGSINVLENCRRFGVKKIIFASSGGAVYGDTTRIPTPENHPLRPVSPYGLSKATVERYLDFYKHLYGLPYLALRYANVYGPRQNPAGEAGVAAIFTELLLKAKAPTINGDGSKTRDFVYISDVVDATLLSLKTKKVGVYNIGTGKETSIKEIFEMLRATLGVEIKPIHAADQPGEQLRSCISFYRINRALGWEPKINLRDGLKKTTDYFSKQLSGKVE